MEQIKNDLIETMEALKAELGKTTKVSAVRARKLTLKLNELGKMYRKASLEQK